MGIERRVDNLERVGVGPPTSPAKTTSPAPTVAELWTRVVRIVPADLFARFLALEGNRSLDELLRAIEDGGCRVPKPEEFSVEAARAWTVAMLGDRGPVGRLLHVCDTCGLAYPALPLSPAEDGYDPDAGEDYFSACPCCGGQERGWSNWTRDVRGVKHVAWHDLADGHRRQAKK
jgi:hypothetical protein